MRHQRKSARITLLTLLMIRATTLVNYGSAQTIPIRSSPEFTVVFVDNSYDVPPTTQATTNRHTNEITTTAIPGFFVTNQTIKLTIKNQPYPATIDGNKATLIYQVDK